MRRLLVVLPFLLASACHRHQAPTVPVVLGPYEVHSELFGVVQAAMTRAGYAPTELDAAGGRLAAPAHTRIRDGEIRLVVQLYREGWVTCSAAIPEGEAAARRAPRARDEAEALALSLQRSLGASGVAAGSTP